MNGYNLVPTPFQSTPNNKKTLLSPPVSFNILNVLFYTMVMSLEKSKDQHIGLGKSYQILHKASHSWETSLDFVTAELPIIYCLEL